MGRRRAPCTFLESITSLIYRDLGPRDNAAIKREFPELAYRLWRVYLAHDAYAVRTALSLDPPGAGAKGRAKSYYNPRPWTGGCTDSSLKAGPFGRPSWTAATVQSAQARAVKHRTNLISTEAT